MMHNIFKLTAWSKVTEKLIAAQRVKESPTFHRIQKVHCHVIFDVLTAVTKKRSVFWVVTSCKKQERRGSKQSLLCLLFNPGDGAVYLSKTSGFMNYTSLEARSPLIIYYHVYKSMPWSSVSFFVLIT
jgi:hypothetical protein